jgi:hypothetical protein
LPEAATATPLAVIHVVIQKTIPEAGRPAKSIYPCRDTITLQDYFRQLWQDCPSGTPVSLAVWLFDLIPDNMRTLSLFAGVDHENEKREKVTSAIDGLNKRFGQHTVYLGGLHGLGDAAPTRIPFFSVPELEDFLKKPNRQKMQGGTTLARFFATRVRILTFGSDLRLYNSDATSTTSYQ